MKKYFIPAMIILAGAFSIAGPLKVSADCGLNPVTHLPSKCSPPFEVPPNLPQGTCSLEGDGTCLSLGCGGVTWSNAIPGQCVSGIITENNVPRCESSYAVTAVLIHQYSMGCKKQGGTCTCEFNATGVTTLVSVCNCRDLPPLH